MKTIKEWLEELPEPYKGRALANMEKQRPGDKGGDHANMRSAIEAAFRWEGTEDGIAYWSDLRDKYKSAPDPVVPEPSPSNALSAIHAIALKKGFPVEEITGVNLYDEKNCVWLYSVKGSIDTHLINLKTDK